MPALSFDIELLVRVKILAKRTKNAVKCINVLANDFEMDSLPLGFCPSAILHHVH